jgi:hypothetical protein
MWFGNKKKRSEGLGVRDSTRSALTKESICNYLDYIPMIAEAKPVSRDCVYMYVPACIYRIHDILISYLLMYHT